LRSGTSVGANVEEALAGFSKNDFIYKMNLALKECHESHYWIRLIRDTSIVSEEGTVDVLNLCDELKKILTSIVKTSQERFNS
jgi:four helix bundle protein